MKTRSIVVLLSFVLMYLIHPCFASDNSRTSICMPGDENWDSSLDILHSAVYTVESNGKDLYIGGVFDPEYYGDPRRVAKLGGTNWDDLGEGVEAALVTTNIAVYAICFKDDDVYITGRFDMVGKKQINFVARWNGYEWFSLGSGLSGTGKALAVLGDDIYVGGHFSQAGGVPAKYLARWDGSEWHAIPGEISHAVYALAAYDGKLYVGGEFGKIDDDVYNSIAMWDGESWHSFDDGVKGPVNAIAVADHGLYIGGSFFNWADGKNINSVAWWNGEEWNNMNGGVMRDVHDIVIDGRDVYIGGHFEYVPGVAHKANSLAKWDGEAWSPIGFGVRFTSDNYAYAYGITVYQGFLYVGGRFNRVGFNEKNWINVARWRIPNEPPVALPDSVETPQGADVTVHVLNNDSDPDGHNLFIESVETDGTIGSVSIDPGNTTVTYTPLTGYNGMDQFQYVITDDHFAGFDTAAVYVEVQFVNQPPVAQDDTAMVGDNSSVTIPVLRNDMDLEADPLIIQSVNSSVTLGTVQIDMGDTTITYSPYPDYTGWDQFSYTITDDYGGIDSATVYIEVFHVNQPPVACNDTLSIQQDSMATIYPLLNDTDPENDPLSIVEVGDIGSSGILVINTGDTSITYLPTIGFSGDLIFDYMVSDGNGGQDTAQVEITVIPVSGVSDQTVPSTYALFQNFPNPFNPVTTLSYALPEKSHVILKIFSVTGSEILTIVDEEKTAGNYQAVWNAQDRFGKQVGSGIYFYQLRAGDYTEIRKMLLVR